MARFSGQSAVKGDVCAPTHPTPRRVRGGDWKDGWRRAVSHAEAQGEALCWGTKVVISGPFIKFYLLITS